MPTKIAIEFCFTEEKYNSWPGLPNIYEFGWLYPSLTCPDWSPLSRHQLLDVTGEADYQLLTRGGHMPIFHHYDRSFDCYHDYTTMQYQPQTGLTAPLNVEQSNLYQQQLRTKTPSQVDGFIKAGIFMSF